MDERILPVSRRVVGRTGGNRGEIKNMLKIEGECVCEDDDGLLLGGEEDAQKMMVIKASLF